MKIDNRQVLVNKSMPAVSNVLSPDSTANLQEAQYKEVPIVYVIFL